MDGVQLPQGYSYIEEAVYFLPFSSQNFLVHILSTSEGWKAGSTLEIPSGFERGTPGSGIQHLNCQAIALTSSYMYIALALHQSILLPRNGRNLNDLTFFQMEKKNETVKRRNWKICLFPQSGKKLGALFFISRCIWLHFHTLHRCHLLPRNAKKLNNFLYFCIRISFHFREVDYASPKWFISMK